MFANLARLFVAAALFWAAAPGAALAQTAPTQTAAPAAPTRSAAPEPPTPTAREVGAYEKEIAARYAWLLAERRVTLHFPDVEAPDAILFFQDITNMNFVLDPEVAARDQRVTVDVKDMALKSALSLVVGQVGCTYEQWRGTVFVTDKKSPAPKPRDVPLGASLTSALERRATLNFPGTPLPDALAFIHNISGIDVEAAPDVADRQVRLRLKDLPLASLLAVICRTERLEMTLVGKSKIVLKARAVEGKKPKR